MNMSATHATSSSVSPTHLLDFITGGSRGLGRAAALHLARAG